MDNKQVKLSIIGFAVLLIGLVGVTYSFFNYTRTGQSNTIRTGRIYFNTQQGDALTLRNVFPMKSTAAATASLDTVTVGIMGDTTYNDGEEFEITIEGVNNTINGKEIPMNYIAIYTEATGATIGESSDTYFDSRETKNANIYKLNATGKVEDGKQVLAGYIKKGATGISGTLTIKAYIDADRIAISDTYPEQTVRTVKTTGYSSSVCETTLTGVTNASTYCATVSSLQDAIDNNNLTSEQINLLVNAGLVNEYTNGTTSEWVDGRVVFTTEEWNSFQNSGTPISFKIKAESNEGLWVNPQIESCIGCKYMYYVIDWNDTTTAKWTTWNMLHQTPTQITSGLYGNYEELIDVTGKSYFLGVKLNSNNEVTNAYACGVKDNESFCIEGTSDGSKYNENLALLQGANLYNNSCTLNDNALGVGVVTQCGLWDNSGLLSTKVSSDGLVLTGIGDDSNCVVEMGIFGCIES